MEEEEEEEELARGDESRSASADRAVTPKISAVWETNTGGGGGGGGVPAAEAIG